MRTFLWIQNSLVAVWVQDYSAEVEKKVQFTGCLVCVKSYSLQELIQLTVLKVLLHLMRAKSQMCIPDHKLCLLFTAIFYHSFTCLQITKRSQPDKLQMQHFKNFCLFLVPLWHLCFQILKYGFSKAMCIINGYYQFTSGEKMQIVFTTQGQEIYTNL